MREPIAGAAAGGLRDAGVRRGGACRRAVAHVAWSAVFAALISMLPRCAGHAVLDFADPPGDGREGGQSGEGGVAVPDASSGDTLRSDADALTDASTVPADWDLDAASCPDWCDGLCTDWSIDRAHCGSCGHGCGDREVCTRGQCVCRPGLALCGSSCVDLQSDPEHCGSCSGRCASTQMCDRGGCVTASPCTDGRALCVDDGIGGCVDLASNALHCGSCDRACAAAQVCVAGTCVDYRIVPGCRTCPCSNTCADRCCPGFSGGALCVSASRGCPVVF